MIVEISTEIFSKLNECSLFNSQFFYIFQLLIHRLFCCGSPCFLIASRFSQVLVISFVRTLHYLLSRFLPLVFLFQWVVQHLFHFFSLVKSKYIYICVLWFQLTIIILNEQYFGVFNSCQALYTAQLNLKKVLIFLNIFCDITINYSYVYIHCIRIDKMYL